MKRVVYNYELVIKYINGEDIPESYTIEELENDCSFMIKVINYSNDKNMYYLCSSLVRSSYEFVKFMIDKFKNDQKFICDVFDYYLECSDNEIERLELLIIMCDLLNKDMDKFLKYKLSLEALYVSKRFNIEAIKGQDGMEDIFDIVQYGFWFIVDQYSSSDIIMKYFAKRFIEDIISDFEVDIEEDLHNKFDSLKALEKFGINNYYLGLLSRYDENLSNYVGCHLELLDDLKKGLHLINKRWDLYYDLVEYKRYDMMLESVHDYMLKHEEECSFTELEILCCVGHDLGILDKIVKYDDIDLEFYDEILKGLVISRTKIMLGDWKHYNNIRDLIIKTLGIKRESFPDRKEVSSNQDVKGRILKFVPKKKDNGIG